MQLARLLVLQNILARVDILTHLAMDLTGIVALVAERLACTASAVFVEQHYPQLTATHQAQRQPLAPLMDLQLIPVGADIPIHPLYPKLDIVLALPQHAKLHRLVRLVEQQL